MSEWQWGAPAPVKEDLKRLELLVKALERYRTESEEYSLAEILQDYHWDAAEQAGRAPSLDAVGDAFVAQELDHARDVLAALCGVTRCQAPGCFETAPSHLGWCLNHDLEQALRLDTE